MTKKTNDLPAMPETKDLVNELMEQDLSQIDFTPARIKIMHRERLFVLPDNRTVKSFKGIVVKFQKTRALWEEGNELPSCRSFDGIRGSTPEIPIQKDCATCEFNVYNPELKRKPCKESRVLYVLPEGGALPIVLTLPPTSLKAWDGYVSSLASMGKATPIVITEFRLESKEKNGFSYAVIAPEFVDDVPVDMMQEVLRYRNILANKFNDDILINESEG
jgi:hypothetical protein